MDKDQGSHLVTLPAEIQGMIAECVSLTLTNQIGLSDWVEAYRADVEPLHQLPHPSDLSSLSRTCQTLNGIVIPILYRRIVLRVPQQWESQDSLQNLVNYAEENLKYTSEILIEPQQRPRDKNQFGEQSRDDSSNDESHNDPSDDGSSNYISDDEYSLQSFLPREQDSDSLNQLVRRLVSKLPRNQLIHFMWDHTCVVDKRTLVLLFDMHGAALRTLRLNRQTWKPPGQLPDGLYDLRLGSVTAENPKRGRDYRNSDSYWQAALVARNCKTLRHLELGSETDAAEDFFGGPLRRRSDTGQQTLAKLVLEDCYGTEVAFPQLSSICNSSRNAHCLVNLTSFNFRQKNLTGDDRKQLQNLLCSLPGGLVDLSVLFDKSEDHGYKFKLKPILRVHGKTLQTLVFDEQGYRRTKIEEGRALLSGEDPIGHLSIISKACPELKELGLVVDWAALRVSNESRQKLFDCVRKMKRLQTLNIRNMPSATAEITWLPIDLHKTWAVFFLENMMEGRNRQSPPVLKTIALGAVTWADVWLGSNYHCSNYFYCHHYELSLRDFLQLRVYEIHYQYDLQGVCSPMLNLIAKGSPRDVQRESSSLSILEPYWLG